MEEALSLTRGDIAEVFKRYNNLPDLAPVPADAKDNDHEGQMRTFWDIAKEIEKERANG